MTEKAKVKNSSEMFLTDLGKGTIRVARRIRLALKLLDKLRRLQDELHQVCLGRQEVACNPDVEIGIAQIKKRSIVPACELSDLLEKIGKDFHSGEERLRTLFWKLNEEFSEITVVNGTSGKHE